MRGVRMVKRLIIQFADAAAFDAARAAEAAHLKAAITSAKRHFMSVEVPPTEIAAGENEKLFVRHLELLQKYYGAEIREEFKYDLETYDFFDPSRFGPDVPGAPSLDDVIKMIRADAAWSVTRGNGVVIAIVDTGIDGSHPEFPSWKRVGFWKPDNDNTPDWSDWHGHGTMCATIAAGTRAAGGRFDGVAPDAGLIGCKTWFYESELVNAYDYLTDLSVNHGMTVVACNSFGINTGTPPQKQSDLFIQALDDAIAVGITVVFSAGNYHALVGGHPAHCAPTSIWQHKSRSDILAVATCTLDRTIWYYSSRGPGQGYGLPNTNRKPDVTAPTPENGRILWGSSVQSLRDGWGTSGACPQVAGLAALIRSKDPSINRTDLHAAIRNSADPLPYPVDCVGAGVIDCSAAISLI